MRRVLLPALAILLLLGMTLPGAQAGTRARVFNPLDPDEGPSPNTVTVSGNGCSVGIESVGVTLGGEPTWVPGDAYVQLYDKDDPGSPIGAEQGPYAAASTPEGDWSGSFVIPPGLEAGLYPVEARCEMPLLRESSIEPAGIVLRGGGPADSFDYTQVRSYTIIASAEPPEPVESEVDFTG